MALIQDLEDHTDPFAIIVDVVVVPLLLLFILPAIPDQQTSRIDIGSCAPSQMVLLFTAETLQRNVTEPNSTLRAMTPKVESSQRDICSETDAQTRVVRKV